MGDPLYVLEHDNRIQLPAHALFVGASMSGKTRLAIQLLSQPQLFNPTPTTILFYYDQFQPQYAEIKAKLEKELGINMILRRGSSISLDELPEPKSAHDHTILLIDDATEQTSASSEIARIATNGRHKNISLWLIWHALYSKHAASRLIAQNIGLFFFLPSLRLESQLRTFASQLGLSKYLLDAYRQCVEDEEAKRSGDHRYLLVDLCNDTPALLRLRSHIHHHSSSSSSTDTDTTTQYCFVESTTSALNKNSR